MFELFNSFTENSKKKATVWPLQMMLLVLCPKILEEIKNADAGAPCSPQMLKKKHFIDEARKALSNPHGGSSKASQTEDAAVCKASTYININDRPNVFFTLVQSATHDLKTLLFSPPSSIKFSCSQGTISQDIDLYIDCFVSFFRINPYIGDLPKVCLNPQSPLIYHLVLVSALYKIITQPRLAWWPEIRKMYSKAGELRSMFNDAVNKVMQATASQGPKTQFSTITKMTGFKLSRPGEENTMQRYFLLGLVKLIHADPLLMLHNPDKPGHEVQNSTSELINGLVSLVHVQQMPEIAQEAMEALLRLHQPEIIALWNPEAPINTFWKISSQVLTSISQKLIQNQLNPNPPGVPPMANNTEILKWLHEILICRNSFLQKHSINANLGSNITICTDSHIVLEEVFFMYLWSIDVNAVLTAMSCFHLLCEEADIRCGADEVAVTQILPNYNVYSDLAAASMTLTTGRALLQKKIMGLLRKIDHPTPGNTQAWEDTCKAWDNVTKNLDIYPKGKLEEGCSSGSIGETIRLRRKPTHHGTSDHELEDQLNEWVNMTGFLCALGSVALQNNTNRSNLSHFLACFRSPSMPGCDTSRKSSLMQSSTGDPQCCLVTQFIENLLKFLVCQHEKFGAHIQKHVKALLGHELNPALYPNLFDQVKLSVEKSSFDSSGQVEVTDLNTQFIENIIFIMKNILEMKSDQPCEYLGVTSIESMMLSIVRYVRHLDSSVHAIQIKIKLCQLVGAMMTRRDELTFRQEMKFRNKLVEYLTDWIMGNSHQVNIQGDICSMSRDLDQASMEAVAALLAGLPLQPEESDRGDLNEAKSQLFLKYLTLFMNLLNDCSEEEQDKAMDPNRKRSMSNLSALRHCTVQAMSNLLNANIESGLMHSIALGYHKDPQTRAAFMEVLTKILQQGTEFETLAETALADRFERLVELVTMIGDKGDLPIAMALASVILRSQMDELARVFVTLFDAKHLLYQLLWNMFSKEVEIADCMQTLFCGNSLASEIMAYCFRFYGQNYLHSLLNPLIQDMMDIEIQNPNLSYEIDPSRLESTENIEENKKNLMIITQKVFDAIVGSASRNINQNRKKRICVHVTSLCAQDYNPANMATLGDNLNLLDGEEVLGEEVLRMSTDEIISRTRLLDNEVSIMRTDDQRIKHELQTQKDKIKENKEKIKVNKTLPYLVSNVIELLDMDPQDQGEEDGANVDLDSQRKGKCAVIKTSTRQTYFLPVIGLVDAENLHPGDLVGVNKDSYLILESLPQEYDSRVKAMEVDERPTEQYSDIGGLDKQIQELIEAVVLPITHKERFEALGIQPPKGVLLYGPPGTGKTLLARACAAQTKSTFLKLAGPQLVQMFIGDGAKLVRDAFALAKEKSPAIIFIDELDAIGTKRFDSEKAGDREVQRTMLELLNQMDGFMPTSQIKVIAATNRVDILDPALLRSGRLDRKIEFPHPNEEARARILQIHSRKMNVCDVNYEELARCTDDFNGAQLKAVCVEAGMIALRREAKELIHEDYMDAIIEVQAKKKTNLQYYA